MTRTGMLCATIVCMPALQASDWPQFRGPYFNGSTDEKDLPSHWSEADGIAWTAELPGPGAATPIVWGDRVFVSSSDPEASTLEALCLDRKTGKVLWGEDAYKGKISRTHRSNFASPSPATDGEVVVFFYGNGELAAFDLWGKRLWGRNVQEDQGGFAFLWTPSTSPLLHGGKLYLQVLQRDVAVEGRGFTDRRNESYILAMDPRTGKTLWRHVRPSKAVAESREAFTTPVPLDAKGRRMLLVAGGDALTAHDPDDGKELWRWETWNPERIGHWRLVPSPVPCEDVVLVCAPKREPVYAIKTGGSGQLDDGAIAWTGKEARDLSSDVPTPAFQDGDFYILSDVRKSLSRAEARTGKVRWTTKTPGSAKYEASPLVADGKVYIVNFDGEVAVVDARDGSVLHVIPTNPTREYPIRSSIVAAHGHLFIRSNRKLLCVGPR